MLEQLPCVCIKPAPFRPQPISSSMEERALRFELERQACQSLRQVLQLKLQQRRTRADLINQGIMPPLKSSAAFHEQRRSLERARTEDYLKRKIRSRPERTELIRMHILEETSAEPSLQVKQLQLKRARLADDLNDKISHRPGPMELIHKNILPVHSIIKHAIETQFPKAAGDNSSCDVDSSDSLSPEQPVGQESPAAAGPPPSPPDTESCSPSPTQDPPSAPRLPPLSGHRPSLKLTSSAHRMGVASLIRTKPNSDRSAQRHKKPKDNQPKIKKLKYHQYVPPDQKGEKEPPPLLDSSYAKILQQQQLFLHLQILTQQQQHYNYQAILPAPPKPQKNLSSSSTSRTTSSPSPPLAAPPAAPSVQGRHSAQSSAPLDGSQAGSLPPNLDEMKVVELKSQLKLRSLPVSGTKPGLIERLKAYQELNGGGGTTPSPTAAGGNTGPGAGGAGRSSHPAAADSSAQQQQIQSCRASSLTSQRAAPRQLVTSSGSVSPPPPPPVSIPLSDHSPATSSPEETGVSSDALEEMMMSPLSRSGLQPPSAPHLPKTIKQEFPFSVPAPCQFSLKPASLQKHRLLPSAGPTAPGRTLDKDQMLKEKDQQIAELTRMLRQTQRLVEFLRMQLQHGSRGAQVPEPVVLVRVKQEPPDQPGVPLTSVHPPFPPPTSSVSCDAEVTVKQEAPETEEVQSLDSIGSCLQAQEAQEQTELHMDEQNQHGARLQQSALQLAQRHVVHRLLLQQQNIHDRNQALENQQKLSLQKKRKSHKQQQKQLNQQTPVKQQLKPLLQQQQTKQPQQIQIHSKIHLKQQQVLIQKKEQVQQQQATQVCQEHVQEQPGSSLSLPTWSDSTAALVTDGEGNHFLIALSNRITDKPEGKATNHITLQKQVENRGPHVSGDRPQQGAAQCVSAPPTLQPLPQNQEAAPSGENSPSPPSHTLSSSLDVLFNRRSPAPVLTAASSPDNKPTEHEDDFIDIILQTGEKSTSFHTASDSSLDRLSPNSPDSSPSPSHSPFQLMLSPPVAPSCDTPPPSVSAGSELQTLVDAPGEAAHFGGAGGGRLEDFLESTTGRPLLGVEPGGLLTLIDDLHSQMLCTPSILDHPPSPMDTFDLAHQEERGLDGMDWLDLTMGVETGEESPSLAPLGPHTPPSIFSTDFLDGCDLQIHWDSCL